MLDRKVARRRATGGFSVAAPTNVSSQKVAPRLLPPPEKKENSSHAQLNPVTHATSRTHTQGSNRLAIQTDTHTQEARINEAEGKRRSGGCVSEERADAAARMPEFQTVGIAP